MDQQKFLQQLQIVLDRKYISDKGEMKRGRREDDTV